MFLILGAFQLIPDSVGFESLVHIDCFIMVDRLIECYIDENDDNGKLRNAWPWRRHSSYHTQEGGRYVHDDASLIPIDIVKAGTPKKGSG